MQHNRREVGKFQFNCIFIVKSKNTLRAFFNYYYFLKKNLFKIYLFIYFWLCWVFVFYARASSSCGKWGPLLIAVRGPLTIAASLVAEHRLQTRRLSSCGSRA